MAAPALNAEAAQVNEMAEMRARREHLLWDRYAPTELSEVYAQTFACRKELREAVVAAEAFGERQRRKNKRKGTQLEILYKFEPVLAELQLHALKKREIHLLKACFYLYSAEMPISHHLGNAWAAISG